MKSYLRIPAALSVFAAASVLACAAVLIGGYYYVAPGLPSAQELRDVRMQVPLSVYSRDGRLIRQFGDVMRTPVAYEDIPPVVIDAFLAAEDERFFEHPGLDYRGVARAGINFVRSLGEDRTIGGSTITQQVARMYFLSRERLFVRKFREWILALRIEAEFTKEEILTLYLNTYFFGQRSYGIVTAARTYFGKELDELTIGEAALLAGIPQRPSDYNPITSAERAAARRAYALRRMRELGMITEAEQTAALAEPVVSRWHGRRTELDARYVAEMARLEALRRFGPDALTMGLKVTTTIDSRLQRAANEAIREALINYDERHGYRGPVGRVELPAALAEEADEPAEGAYAALSDLLTDYPNRAQTVTAVVLRVDEEEADVYLRDGGTARIGFDAVAWAAPYIDDSRVGARPQAVADVLEPGDVVRFRTAGNGELRLAQLPDVQGALAALDPTDGAVVALGGGFDFDLSNWNRAIQSTQQPGSAFKPFVYSAALEHGFHASSIVNDAPLTRPSAELEAAWRPGNYSGRYYGPTRFREALVRSQNLASVRVAEDIGMNNLLRHLRGFGFDAAALPRNLAMSLGAGNVSPLNLARAYAVFANGGFHVEPYFIDRIEDASGNVLYSAEPVVVCAACQEERERLARERREELAQDAADLYPGPRFAPRVISPQNAYLMTDIMQDVIRRGTGQRARQLGRGDLAGKTGTTNEFVDAWFGGYNPDIVATAWVGFDDYRSLGRAGGANEEGSRTALPMWISFMREALAGAPERPFEEPPGIVHLRINPTTGLAAGGSSPDTVFEKYYINNQPEREVTLSPGRTLPSRPGEEPAPRSSPGDIFR